MSDSNLVDSWANRIDFATIRIINSDSFSRSATEKVIGEPHTTSPIVTTGITSTSPTGLSGSDDSENQLDNVFKSNDTSIQSAIDKYEPRKSHHQHPRDKCVEDIIKGDP